MKPLNEMTVVELKALAFDTLQDIERGQQNLRVINTEMVKRNTVVPEVKKDEQPTV